ncbi:AAA family ATPase [uncultured Cloacibacillus sp.]|uniref:AAA family ATPase n=1 Tax=uncultured Cloacibacillus sp. TaxID=889794 RepID=UPI0026DD9960|nr:AAA family ATPase [uncultured Cloacibacillus sp.]
MVSFISVKDAAKLWGITDRQIYNLCRNGRIKGATKVGRSWMIPGEIEKPVDLRVKTGAYRKPEKHKKLPLPVGVSDYCLASTKYYYIDKTLMIKDFLDERPIVSLFTRPRRFGKTLNMDMLRVFFEKADSDTSVYFRDKKIWKCGKFYQEFQGQYPVIYVTFKDVKCDDWDTAYDSIRMVLRNEVQRHAELLNSCLISDYDKEYLKNILTDKASEVEISMILLNLSRMLDAHYSRAPVIIIDEYDTPIQQGYASGYYEKVVGFMRNLFSGGLKDNKHLSFGFLTGVLRVAKESIFSGLNNIVVYSVLDDKYSAYFGFTPDEVMQMAKYYGVPEKYEEIRDWYDGYRFGKSDIYNPWSVINYFSQGCKPQAYWVSTGSNDIIGEIIARADQKVYDQLTSLVSGNPVFSYIDTSVVYPEINNNPSAIYSILLVSGYLNAVKTDSSRSADTMCELALPNREIVYVYTKEILQKLESIIPQSTVISFHEALYSGDGDRIRKLIHDLLLKSASNFDVAGENFYHGLMLGLCAMLSDFYVTSNRESGEGRFDIQLRPHNKRLPGILIELKAEKKTTPEKLKQLAETALRQIEDNKYDTEMINEGVKTIYKYGVAFSGKNVEISVETTRESV